LPRSQRFWDRFYLFIVTGAVFLCTISWFLFLKIGKSLRFFRRICVNVRREIGVPSALLAAVKRAGGIKFGALTA
jgi:hypothetical protein